MPPVAKPTTSMPSASAERAVTLRGVALGLLGVVLICGLTPYNDYVVGNTYLIGNYLPVGVVLLVLLAAAVNAPLARWKPRWALHGPELAVALGMVLVACAVGGAGLMRWLPSGLIGLQYHASSSPDASRVIHGLEIAEWVFPTFTTPAEERLSDTVIQYYMMRTPREMDSLRVRVHSVPWRAWLTPAVAWGVLLIGVFGAILCLAAIVRHQWMENERLPFPLATVWLSLIEPPARGRALNGLFSSRGFWFACGLVFVIHLVNGLSLYYPKLVPAIPLGYNFGGLFEENPLRHSEWLFKISRVYFSLVGIAYFVRTNITFSLWAFYVILQIVLIGYGSFGQEFPSAARFDQQLGSLVMFGAGIIWLGRNHWRMVLRQMFRGPAPDDPEGAYLPYRLAGWGFVAGNVVVVGWLMAAGATLAGAVVVTLVLMLSMLVIARVVAETGLFFMSLGLYFPRPFIMGLHMPVVPVHTTQESFMAAGLINQSLGVTLRESLSPFATHALRIGDAHGVATGRTRGVSFMMMLVLALVVGYLVSGAATLYVQYNYGSTLAGPDAPMINAQALDIPREIIGDVMRYEPPFRGYDARESVWRHFLIGIGVTALLVLLQFRFVSWPLHPVGFVLMYSYPLAAVWFSLFIGWLIKVPLIRFGGADLYRASRGFFIGLIVGEAGAAALWLVVAVIRSSLGLQYHLINLLPV
jgi:hypothetical protein